MSRGERAIESEKEVACSAISLEFTVLFAAEVSGEVGEERVGAAEDEVEEVEIERGEFEDC